MIGDTTRRIASRPRTVRRVEGMDTGMGYNYYGFLDYKEDRYTTVYGYMD